MQQLLTNLWLIISQKNSASKNMKLIYKLASWLKRNKRQILKKYLVGFGKKDGRFLWL